MHRITLTSMRIHACDDGEDIIFVSPVDDQVDETFGEEFLFFKFIFD